MTRGNQRDLAREKNAKKNIGKQKEAASHEGNAGLTLEQRKARDAERMRLKQLAKQGGQTNAQEDGPGPSASK